MKKHYDFAKAEQGKLHRPLKALRIPIFLDEDVQRSLISVRKRKNGDLSKLVNAILRSQLDVSEMLK